MRACEQICRAAQLRCSDRVGGSPLATISLQGLGRRRRVAIALAAALAAAVMLPAVPAAAGEVQVEVTLHPQRLAAGEYAQLKIEVRGSGMFSRVRFEPRFRLENFEIVAGPERFEGLEVVNGTAGRSYGLTWYLRALDEGPAAVRSIELDFGGESRSVPAVTAEVGPPRQQREQRRRRGAGRRVAPGSERPAVFVRAEIEPRRPWAGQQAVYSLWIYSQLQVDQLSLKEVPQFPGFWVETVPVSEDSDGETVEVDGEPFLRKLLLRRALFPLSPGRHELPATELYALVRVPERGPFAPLLSRSRQITVASNPLAIEVRQRPPAPPGYAGVVGEVGMTARLSPPELAVGEAATLEVELSGRGELSGMEAPDVEPPDGLSLLPPEATGGTELDGSTVAGTRRWRWAVVPERPGVWKLPPIETVYFDPEAGEYRRTATEPLLLRARPAAAPAEPAAGGGLTLHPIRSAALPVEAPRRWGRSLGWLFAVPWGVVLALSLVRRGGPQGRRQGGAGGARRFRGRLEQARRESRPRQAAAAIEAAWRDDLAERWGVSTESPAAAWCERLRAAAAPRQAVEALAALIDDLHYLRHAPQLSAIAALRDELIDRSRDLQRALR